MGGGPSQPIIYKSGAIIDTNNYIGITVLSVLKNICNCREQQIELHKWLV